jgi:phage terminase large subunit-like protein
MEGTLPDGWEQWPLDQKERFIEELKYNWEFWARPSQLPPDGDWNVWFVLGGRGVGKVLSVDFPIWKADALPSGEINQFHRSTMGAVRVGDYVLGPDGEPTLVIGAYDPEMHDEWVVTFSDGSTVLTDLNHRWCTWTHRDRKQYARKRKGGANRQDYPEEWWSHTAPVRGSNEPYGPQIRTTKEILDTLKVGRRGDLNHSIPVAKPLQLPEAKLPIDPYCLGAWLGDGHANGASMSSHEDDMPFMRAQFEGAGYTTTSRKDAQMFGVVGGFHRDLRESNLLGNKHIPEEYLMASYDQRLALLQGLMDTDGSIYSNGRTVEFCSALPELAQGVYSLLASFGMRPTIKVGEAWAYHRDGSRTRHSDRYRVSCRPTLDVFRMPRKVERLRLADTQNKRNAARMIVSIEPTGKRSMMRCIKVAHESSLFLVGESFIPTANTRTGAEFVKAKLLQYPGCRIGVIGQTIGAARDITIEGESGILSVIPPKHVKKYNRSLGQIFLHNGSMVKTFSGGDPEKLRGFQSHFIWMDEICAYQKAQETYDMALMGLRLGLHPQIVLTSTPKPSPLIIELVNRSRTEPDLVKIVTESTFANSANLAASTLEELRRRYEGTTLGRQELYAELILEEPGALWKRPQIESARKEVIEVDRNSMVEIVVGVDPNMSQTTERATECGIIVVGKDAKNHGYVLEDGSMIRPSPDAWARRVVELYHKWGANSIAAEVNQGYDLVVHTIHTIDPLVVVKKVYSQRGKALRAEPIAALAEQGRIHHVGMYPELEDQMVQWVPGNQSPDRLDACVHAFTKVMLGGGVAEFFAPPTTIRIPGVVR